MYCTVYDRISVSWCTRATKKALNDRHPNHNNPTYTIQ